MDHRNSDQKDAQAILAVVLFVMCLLMVAKVTERQLPTIAEATAILLEAYPECSDEIEVVLSREVAIPDPDGFPTLITRVVCDAVPIRMLVRTE
ncbi:MAG: hypothetical protein M3Q81_03575 [bacterium]|nr:hypothetical protein [bacterium]